MEKKEIKELANDLLNNKITLEDIILNYSIEVAGEVADSAYNMNFRNNIYRPISLALSTNNRYQEFYTKVLDYIKNACTISERIANSNSFSILFNIIEDLSDEYKEKITTDIFNLIEPYLKNIILSKGNNKDSSNKLNLFFANICTLNCLPSKKVLDLFEMFFNDKNAGDIFYIDNYLLYNFNINDFTLIIDAEKFKNSELMFSNFNKNDDNNNYYYKLYNTFISLIDKNDEFVKNSILTKQDIFKFIFKNALDISYRYTYNPLDPDIIPRVDRVIKIIKETLGEEKGKEYIKKNLFKSFKQSDVRYMISAFPFKDYKEYIPDTKVGEEIKNLLNLNSNKLSEADIKNIKKLPVPEQNKFLSNPNVSMDTVKEIIGKRYVSKELLNLVKERRPGDYLEFCKLKARQYLINSMKDELTDLKDMGLIEDVIVDFKIPEGQEDSLNLYLNLK